MYYFYFYQHHDSCVSLVELKHNIILCILVTISRWNIPFFLIKYLANRDRLHITYTILERTDRWKNINSTYCSYYFLVKRRLNIGVRERSSFTSTDPLVSTHSNIFTIRSHSDLEYCNIIIYYYTLNVYLCVNVLTVCWRMIDVQQRYDDDDDDSDVVSDVTVYIHNILCIMCLCVYFII